MKDQMRNRYCLGRSILTVILAVVALAISQTLTGQAALAADDSDCPRPPDSTENPDCGTHNMMLVGRNAAYLSHLPMFHNEHRYQLILEAAFNEDGNSALQVYFDDRAAHPEIGMYTVKPSDRFVLSRAFEPTVEPQRNAFLGTVFRGHLERGGVEIEGLQDIDVTVTRVVYAREFGPNNEKSDELHYVLFGNQDELFLSHQITQPPDFDQIVAIKVNGHQFAADELLSGVLVTIPGRENSGAERLRVDESITAKANIGNAPEPVTLQIDVKAEPYFEDGELRVPATFAPTPLEVEAGF